MLLATAMEQGTEGVIITDADGTIQYVNAAFEKVTGYTRHEAVGANPRILKSGEHDEGFYRRLWRRLLDGQVVEERLINRRKDGSLYTQDTTIAPVRAGGDEITHFLAIFRDVTDEVHLEERFYQAQKMEAVGRLAGGIAHDFNNVLTVIRGNAQFALQDLDASDPRAAEIRQIAGAADRASSLTRQLLAFSRRQVSQPVVLDVGEVIGRAESMLGRVIGEDIALDVSIAPELDRVRADPAQIEQILINLAVNARDAMPGGGRLMVRAENAELTPETTRRFDYPVTPGRYVRIAVTDTGIGMDPETQRRIFEPFFTTKEADRGTGLGLSTVYGIVKQSGGYIWVYSEKGQGTTFKIYLPRTAEDIEPEEPPEPEPGDPGGSETVLVVEDQEAVAALVERVLQGAGYRVVLATDGAEAIERFHEDGVDVDLLLTDVVMPRMGGPVLAAQLRARSPGLRVLFMSGYGEERIAHRGILEPGTHLLEKPFDPHGLRRRVREVLDQPGPDPGE